jgi:hypothetical protein
VIDQLSKHQYRIHIPNGEKVQVGSSLDNFTPSIFHSRWDECFVQLVMIGENAVFPSSTTDGKSIQTENNSIIMNHSLAKANPIFNEGGGVDTSFIILKPIPGDFIQFNLNLGNCICYPQGSLKDEFPLGKKLGRNRIISFTSDTKALDQNGNIVAVRSQHVVNSLVFYHASKGKIVTVSDVSRGLTTGQIGILYSMIAKDNRGQFGIAEWVWRKPFVFLHWKFNSSPTYPIQLIPYGDTFGYTSIGGTGLNMGASTLTMSGYNYTGEASTGVSVTTSAANSDASPEHYDIAVYTTDNPLAFITNAHAAITVTNGTSQTTRSANFAVAPTFTARTYYIIENNDGGAGLLMYANAATNSDKYYSTTEAYGTWPATLTQPPTGWTVGNNGTYQYTMYITVTPSGGASVANAAIPLGFIHGRIGR